MKEKSHSILVTKRYIKENSVTLHIRHSINYGSFAILNLMEFLKSYSIDITTFTSNKKDK